VFVGFSNPLWCKGGGPTVKDGKVNVIVQSRKDPVLGAIVNSKGTLSSTLPISYL